jgi:hypothetical protein
MDYQKIKKIAILYLAAPIIVFILGFLKITIAVPAAVLLGLACYLCAFSSRGMGVSADEARIPFNWKILLLLALLSVVWSFLGGQGNLYYQSPDWYWRNAIFRDIISYSWPVKYAANNSALVYYICHWMIPALFGKAALLITGNPNFAWTLANIVLWFWTSLGVFIFLALMLVTLNIRKMKHVYIALLTVVFFSGLDVAAILIEGGSAFFTPPILHLEWWENGFQYSSMTTVLFWVFNQGVAAWIAVMCVINEKSVKNYALIGLLLLPYAPLPLIGLFFIAAALAVVRAAKIGVRDFFKEAASPQNIMAVASILPVFALYYAANAALEGTGSIINPLIYSNGSGVDLFYIFVLLVYIYMEAGLYFMLVYDENKKDPLFFIALAELLLIPIFKIGGSTDFIMRASIPALVILLTLVIGSLIKRIDDWKSKSKRQRFAAIALVLVLALGAVTPFYEFYRGFYNVQKYGVQNSVNNDIGSLGSGPAENFGNFVAADYQNSIFFKYLAD